MGLGRLIKNALRGTIRWVVNEDNYTRDQASPMTVSIGGYVNSSMKTSNPGPNNSERGLNFVVFPAVGGKVVQFTTYDPKTDRSMNNLYIVTDKEDLGEELSLIITKESLTR